MKRSGWLIFSAIVLIVGIILIVAGFVVLSPTPSITVDIARWFGIVASAIAAITAITWMPYYPVWAFIYIAIAVVVIYGLAAREEVPAA